mgnify:FL=1
MQGSNAQAYLVNTGWNGSGKRISIKATRAIIDAILNGDLDEAPCHNLPIFNLSVPTQLEHVTSDLLDPRSSYGDEDEWQQKAEELATLFIENFSKFTDTANGMSLVAAGPSLLAMSE